MGRGGGRYQAEGTAQPNRGERKATACLKGTVRGLWLEPECTQETREGWLGQRVRLCETPRVWMPA